MRIEKETYSRRLALPLHSASDAKGSITKGDSLKELTMAALQGLDSFDGGPPTAPPRRPAKKSKWELPPQMSFPP